MNGFEEFKKSVKGQEFQAVILFADIMNASEISNNTSIENYAYIINQFHKCASQVYEFLQLNNYQNNIVELTLKGDEVCLILHSIPLVDKEKWNLSEQIDEALKRDCRDAIRFAIAMKLLWRASEYNQQRIRQDIFPRDLGIGIHQGAVYFYKDNTFPSSLHKDESSEGYAINLAKRIETESRNGKHSKILVSGSVRYWSQKIPIPIDYDNHIPKEKLKGISTDFSLYEIKEIKLEFSNFINDLIEKLEFNKEIWKKYELLKEKNPEDFWTQRLIEFKSRAKDEKIAVKSIEEKEKISEKDYRFYFLEAKAFYDMGNYNEAIKNYNKALEINPSYALAYYNRGLAYYTKGEYDQAIFDYNKALEINPSYADAYNNRGLAYYNKGEYDRAISDYNKALEINPSYALAYSNRGFAYFDLDKYNKAVNDFKKAIEIDNKHKDAYCGLGITYYKMKDKSKAIENYKKAIALDKRYAGKIDELIKTGYFYTKPQLKAINELLKEIEY